MRATYSPSTCGMHHMSLRHGLRWFSARRRRTVSRERLPCSVSLTSSSANSSRVQRARPSGGFEQAVATSRASSLPESLRSAPGRGSSLSASSRLPSTKRRLVRYTVDPPTETLAAIASSPIPASAANKICARLILRAACFPPLSIAASCARSASLSSTRYRMFIADPPLSRATMNRANGDSLPVFTPRQGQYLAFIHAYTLVNGRPPAQADIQRFFRLTPPSVHQMLLTLERSRLISRRAGMARSIVVLIDRAQLPALEPGHGQPVKITVQRY